MSAPALVSIGDDGVLNKELSKSISDVWIDRDLGWLDFNDRVLAEALDPRTPLLERAKFLAIFTSNLEEFFMKRVSILRNGSAPGRLQLLEEVRNRLIQSLRRQAECFRDQIVPELAKNGIHLKKWDDLSPAPKDQVGHYFDSEISPALTPLVFDPTHAFPFLSNLSTSLAFVLYDPDKETPTYARIKVPAVLKQWIPISAEVPAGQQAFISLHEVIRGNVHKLYRGMQLSGTTLFRLTRDAEVEIDSDSDEALRDVVRQQIKQRRYEPVVRLEFAPGSDQSIREMLRQRFDLSPSDVYDLPEELDYTSLFQLGGLSIARLKDPPWNPLPSAVLEDCPDVFSAIRAGDVLVHHPYDSFDDSVEHFIATAADDPDTVAVKTTAYRVGDDTPFVRSLVRGAEGGKQVACIIEIKARFDEERNLHWASDWKGPERM